VIAIPLFCRSIKKNHIFYFGQYGTQTAMLCFNLGKVYIYIPILVFFVEISDSLFIIKCFWPLKYTIKPPLRCSTWSKRWYDFCRIIFQTLKKPGWISLSLNMKNMNKETLYKLNIQVWCDVTLCHCINSSCSSEMSGMNYLIQHNIQEDLNLQQHYCENLKSPTVLALCTIKLNAGLCGISSCHNNLVWNTNARMLSVEGNR